MRTDCFTLEDIRRVFTIESYQKDIETFLKTHYPLSIAYKAAGSASVEREMLEDSLLDQWQATLTERRRNREYIRPYIIWGAPGTGKTELCRWLEVTLPKEHPHCLPVRVAKRDLAMYGILGVAQKLSPKPMDLDNLLVGTIDDESTENLFKILLKMIAKLGAIQIINPNREEAFGVMANQIERNIRARQKKISESDDLSTIGQTLEFFTILDKRQHELNGIKMDIASINKTLYKKLTNLFAEVNDVKELIFDYIKVQNKKGNIPVLIFDDVTHLGDSVDDFISVITDISGSEEEYVCDFIIGTTTDFFNSKFRNTLYQTAQERISEIRLSPGEIGKKQHANWLLGELGVSHFLHFAYRYLDAARSTNCNVNPLFVSQGFNYYPFSQTFLINLYHRVEKEIQALEQSKLPISLTPRFMIQLLRNTLLEYNQSQLPPSQGIDRALTIDTRDFFPVSQQNKDRWGENLLAIWWYGEHLENEIVLSLPMIDALGLPLQLPSSFVKDEEIHLGTTGPLVGEIIKPSISPGGEVKNNPVPTPVPTSIEDPQLKSLIRRWCLGQDADISIQMIEKGFNKILKVINASFPGDLCLSNLFNPRSTRTGPRIAYNPSGDREADFKIGDSSPNQYYYSLVSEQQFQVILERERAHPTKNLYLPLNEDDFFNLYKIEKVKGEPERDLYLSKFLQMRGNDIYQAQVHQRRLVKERLEKELGHSLEAFLLAAFLTVSRLYKTEALISGVSSEAEILNLLMMPYDIDVGTWNDSMQRALPRKLLGSDLLDLTIKLFHSMFSLRGEGSVIDGLVLDQAMHEIEATGGTIAVLRNARRTGDRYKIISPNGMSFDEYVILLQSLIQLAEQEQASVDLEEVNSLISLFTQLDQAPEIGDHLMTLRPGLKGLIQTYDKPVGDCIAKLNQLQPYTDKVSLLLQLQQALSRPYTPNALEYASFRAILRKIEASEQISVAQRLEQVISTLEREVNSAKESSLDDLTDQVKEYYTLKEML